MIWIVWWIFGNLERIVQKMICCAFISSANTCYSRYFCGSFGLKFIFFKKIKIPILFKNPWCLKDNGKCFKKKIKSKSYINIRFWVYWWIVGLGGFGFMSFGTMLVIFFIFVTNPSLPFPIRAFSSTSLMFRAGIIWILSL